MTTWGQVIDGRKTYKLHQGQSAVLRSVARFTAALAGLSGGKTVTGPLWIMLRIKRLVESGRDFVLNPILGLVLAPTDKILNRATIRVFLQMFAGTELQGVYKKTPTPQYILPHGLGTIYFLSGYIPDWIEGDQYDFAWLDEGGQLRSGSWIAIQGRTAMRQAPVLITSTIYRMNWIKKEVIRRFRAGDKNYNVISWDSTENPEFPIEEYERARDSLPPALFGMRHRGVIPENDALVFSSWDFEHNVETCECDPARPILVGCNFSANPLTWVLAQSGPHATINVFDELVLPETTTQGALDTLHGLYGEHRGRWKFYGDSTCRSTHTTASLSDYQLILRDWRFGRRTVSAPEVPIDPIDRIAATNDRFLTPEGDRKLLIDPRCKGLITDLDSRFREEEWRSPKSFKESEGAGPISDALTFIIHHVHPLGRIESGPVLLGKSPKMRRTKK